MKKIAVIDLGTNTFNLLIATVSATDFKVLYHTKIGSALGMGSIIKNRLHPDAIVRAMDALKIFKQKCDELQVDTIKALGTSVIRDAENGLQFCELVREKLGIHIQVITGIEEAQLIYEGVKWSYDFKKPAMIVDIGGGSTEFILADSNGILKTLSLNIGVSRIFQELHLNDPLSNFDIKTIERWLEQRTEGALNDITCPILVGASGSFETLYQVYYNQEFPETKECCTMDIGELKSILFKMIESNLEERQKNPHILPIRQLMMPITAVKINWLINKFGVQEFYISPHSLKEGALKENKN